jgi:hypothetical protein
MCVCLVQEEELKSTVLLVFANKQDQKGAMSEVEVSQALGLHAIKDRQWHICKSAATKGEGLSEGASLPRFARCCSRVRRCCAAVIQGSIGLRMR